MPDVGRPNAIDELTLKKLEDAFSNGGTDREACFLANISQQTLYNYQKEHPEFIERKESLKDMIKFQAKQRVKEAIIAEKTCDTAKWYLERKGKDEGFSPRTEVTGKDGKDLQVNIINYGDNNTPQLQSSSLSDNIPESDGQWKTQSNSSVE